MHLAEAGKLDLDAPATDVLPEFLHARHRPGDDCQTAVAQAARSYLDATLVAADDY